MGKTADMTVVQKTRVRVETHEGHLVVLRELYPSTFVESCMEGKKVVEKGADATRDQCS